MATPVEKKARYTCAAIANALLEIAWSGQPKKSLSNLKLQKLVYFAHGWYLGIYHQPLVWEQCQAWKYGPVFLELYTALRKYGAGDITEKLDAFDSVDPESDDYEFLRILMRKYGNYSASELISITHNPGSPWRQCGAGRIPYREIPNETIKKYYTELATK